MKITVEYDTYLLESLSELINRVYDAYNSNVSHDISDTWNRDFSADQIARGIRLRSHNNAVSVLPRGVP